MLDQIPAKRCNVATIIDARMVPSHKLKASIA
jgi:hypothetical protein